MKTMSTNSKSGAKLMMYLLTLVMIGGFIFLLITDMNNKKLEENGVKTQATVIQITSTQRRKGVISKDGIAEYLDEQGNKHYFEGFVGNAEANVGSKVNVVYNKDNPDESFTADPFNHYGKSKWQAETLVQEWYKTHNDWNIDIIRPTVIFGERNRGNVYNLLNNLAKGYFINVGKGTNVKSMAYVGNVVAFVKYLIDNITDGYNVFNYVDKPDLDMNHLTELVCRTLGKRLPSVRLPYWIGMAGGYFFDAIAFIFRIKPTISSVRIKKYCSTTQYDSTKAHNTGFVPPYTLSEGLTRTMEFEFIHPRTDDISFESE